MPLGSFVGTKLKPPAATKTIQHVQTFLTLTGLKLSSSQTMNDHDILKCMKDRIYNL